MKEVAKEGNPREEYMIDPLCAFNSFSVIKAGKMSKGCGRGG